MDTPNAALFTPRIVTHPRLPQNTTWMAIGALALLDAEQFVSVILSRSLFAEKLERELTRIESAVKAGAVAVGGFISFPEKSAAKRLASIPELRLIRVLPNPLINYPLTDSVRKRIAAGKTLILSGITGTEMTLTRANCVRTNEWILQLCNEYPSQTKPKLPQKSTFARPTKQAKSSSSFAQTPSQNRSSSAPKPPQLNSTPIENDPAAIFL